MKFPILRLEDRLVSESRNAEKSVSSPARVGHVATGEMLKQMWRRFVGAEDIVKFASGGQRIEQRVRTKKRIVATAAPIFNVKGFAGTSISDILEATGLQKGGLYLHFSSKDELALAAFDHAVRELERRRSLSQVGRTTALGRLASCVRVVETAIYRPAVPGGCPILNTAVEAQNTHAALKQRAADAMVRWQKFIASIVEEGIAARSIRHDADPAAVASILTAALEGGLVVSALLDEPAHIERVGEHLRVMLRGLRSPRSPVLS